MFEKLEDDLPPQVMDMLRIFLAARARGDQAVLVLESRNGTLATKYRSKENVVGEPAPVPAKRRKTPARARRSKLRLERFAMKKLEEKNKAAAENADKTGNQDCAGETSTRLVLELNNVQEKSLETPRNTSPILQLDGTVDEEKSVFTFVISNYAEEDIAYTIDEIFPEKTATLDSLVRCRPRSADHLCTITVKPASGKSFIWPVMNYVQTEVIRDLKKVSG